MQIISSFALDNIKIIVNLTRVKRLSRIWNQRFLLCKVYIKYYDVCFCNFSNLNINFQNSINISSISSKPRHTFSLLAGISVIYILYVGIFIECYFENWFLEFLRSTLWNQNTRVHERPRNSMLWFQRWRILTCSMTFSEFSSKKQSQVEFKLPSCGNMFEKCFSSVKKEVFDYRKCVKLYFSLFNAFLVYSLAL